MHSLIVVFVFVFVIIIPIIFQIIQLFKDFSEHTDDFCVKE